MNGFTILALIILLGMFVLNSMGFLDNVRESVIRGAVFGSVTLAAVSAFIAVF